MTNIAQMAPARVVIGVDTHKDVHVAVALDNLGRTLDSTAIPTTPKGYRQAGGVGRQAGAGRGVRVEGTGRTGPAWPATWPSGLLGDRGHPPQPPSPPPERQVRPGRRPTGAGAVISGEAAGMAKSGDDPVEMIRVLRVARSSAMKARTQTINAIQSLLRHGPRRAT